MTRPLGGGGREGADETPADGPEARHRALELIAAGRTESAGEAAAIGLVLHRAPSAPQDEGLRVEAELAPLAYQTADAEEGPAAFVEKRPPNFHDR